MSISSNKIKTIKSKYSISKSKERGRIPITSLLDVFTILLIFLLKSFSTQSDFIINYLSQVNIPESFSEDLLKPTFFVEINKNEIILNDKKVIELSELLVRNDNIIPELQSSLKDFEKKYIAFSSSSIDEITIIGDEKVECGIIKLVMSTCAQVGFSNIYLATRKK